MNRSRRPITLRLHHWPRILPTPTLEATLDLQPLQDLSTTQSASIKTIWADHVVCVVPCLSTWFTEVKRVLQPTGQCHIVDVFRRRNLPSDLEGQPTLTACGLTQTPHIDEFRATITRQSFRIDQEAEIPNALELLLNQFDSTRPQTVEPSQPVSEAEWIAATQACCGINPPRSEQLSEILKADNIHALWIVKQFAITPIS